MVSSLSTTKARAEMRGRRDRARCNSLVITAFQDTDSDDDDDDDNEEEEEEEKEDDVATSDDDDDDDE